MHTYEHSVSLDVSRCTGCTTCLKHCPTEAIRIHNGHAQINTNRCIDCGVCIRICTNKAKKATYSKLDQVMNGDLDEMIDALTAADQAEKLKATQEN